LHNLYAPASGIVRLKPIGQQYRYNTTVHWRLNGPRCQGYAIFSLSISPAHHSNNNINNNDIFKLRKYIRPRTTRSLGTIPDTVGSDIPCGGGGEGFGSAERLPTIIINSVAGAWVNEPGFTREEFSGFFLIHILL